MSTDLAQSLAALMPTERHFVMDLLEQAGLDVSPWRVTGDGKAVKAVGSIFLGERASVPGCVLHRATTPGNFDFGEAG